MLLVLINNVSAFVKCVSICVFNGVSSEKSVATDNDKHKQIVKPTNHNIPADKFNHICDVRIPKTSFNPLYTSIQSGMPIHINKPVLNQNMEKSAPAMVCENSFTLSPSIVPILNKTSNSATKNKVPSSTKIAPKNFEITLKI